MSDAKSLIDGLKQEEPKVDKVDSQIEQKKVEKVESVVDDIHKKLEL